ncbi:MAG: sacsin N-terminal ATP-binding-like domain-containing protein [Solirubrobacteraceae bacterium]
MATDYDQIREEHRRRYGEDVGDYGQLLVDLYADRTHFVLELLQNAQDAGATRIRFDLRGDRLEVNHNGRPFTDADVRGICGIKRSTKEDDTEQIGRFGIGFKSVYAFTRRPAVHCGDEHFAIEHYVHPHAIPAIDLANGWTTLQVLPFDRDDVPPTVAVAEIGQCLAEMSARTILFLRDLRELEWITPEAEGVLLREPLEDGAARRVRLLHGHARPQDAEEWLVFEQPIELVVGREANSVEIAFLTTRDDDGIERVVAADDTELVAFFPTSRETHLGYLIQGPFIPTPARDNVRERHEVNQRLVATAAELTVEGLVKLRDQGLLGVSALECMPLEEHHFPPDGLLRPIYDTVRSALAILPLIPGDDGRHRRAAELRLARGTDLRELFSPHQLGELLGSNKAIHWASVEISNDRTPTLHRYLVGHRQRYSWSAGRTGRPLVEGMELDPGAVIRRLGPGFLQRQPTQWMIRLYAWLGGQKAMARDLRDRAIVRASDGAHVAAFANGKQQIWLPPAGETRYPIVDREIARDEDALGFLKLLGLTEPDSVDEVITSVLPRYAGDSAVPD